jgi:hypothetical protein
MKDRVDKSMGVVTHIEEVLARFKPTDPLILAKREAHKKRSKKRNCSDSSGNSPVKVLTTTNFTMRVQENHPCKVLVDATRSRRWDQVYPRIPDDNTESSFCLSCSGHHQTEEPVEDTLMCENSVCTLSGTSISVMSHCDIHHECPRRDPIIFYV